ncbi:hypothetical protein [Blastococcus sp. KM273129]|uniref:4-fold beta flower protein n=1 Tax=Blastococcus sp. KM273129 TaxID=2570315 RepID=UPI001F23CCB8|nr:hypothetical protein [Blastococcus sp. KM273129]MCF6733626.1 hypothetical protein [Blastococcus sp. KM273129]
MDRWLWTWSGASFGFQDGDQLFGQDGSHVGKFVESEIFDARTGRYLGEVIDDRLIRKVSKAHKVRTPPSPRTRSARAPRAPRSPRVMRVGYEDWPLG